MTKCNRVGCTKEATHHQKIPIGDGLIADAWFCDEHYEEGVGMIKHE